MKLILAAFLVTTIFSNAHAAAPSQRAIDIKVGTVIKINETLEMNNDTSLDWFSYDKQSRKILRRTLSFAKGTLRASDEAYNELRSYPTIKHTICDLSTEYKVIEHYAGPIVGHEVQISSGDVFTVTEVKKEHDRNSTIQLELSSENNEKFQLSCTRPTSKSNPKPYIKMSDVRSALGSIIEIHN